VALLGARGAVALILCLKPREADARAGFAAVALGICVTVSLCWVFRVKLVEAYQCIDARMALYHKVAEEKLQNAVVFIRSVKEEFAPWNLTRNTPDFQGSVLYVHDLGSLNHLLISQYPGRRFFRYEYDESQKPILREIIPDEAIDAGG
jgi:hypothetical protein